MILQLFFRAGSQNADTLAMKGAPVVALREGHAASRSRWSACTMVTSCEQHARRIPGLELMFKASGELLEKKLQTFARGLGCNWLSVVTGPKGSYREEHVLQYLERHLPQMTEGRRWRLLLLDAYAPQMSDSVRRLCWQRGYNYCDHPRWRSDRSYASQRRRLAPTPAENFCGTFNASYDQSSQAEP